MPPAHRIPPHPRLQRQLCRRRRAAGAVRPARRKATHRFDDFVGVQEAFVDYHLRNVSDRYDFDSIRVGIQPFQFDFRGFLFNDQQLGIRLFGNRDNNRFQYNLAAFWRLEKDTNSASTTSPSARASDWILHANLYPPGFPVRRPHQPGEPHLQHATASAATSRSTTTAFRCGRRCSAICAARDYDVVYLGYNADGQIGRINLTASAYGAVRRGPAQLFTSRKARDPALLRRRRAVATTSTGSASAASGLFASGDSEPVRQHRDAASTRSSRTRSSPAPTPATGSARPSPSPAAAARSRSTAATAS